MRCGDCKHYEPARNPETGRQLPSKQGQCTYPVEWPKLPKAFLNAPQRWGCDGRYVEWPIRSKMWRDATGPCATFEARTGKKA